MSLETVLTAGVRSAMVLLARPFSQEAGETTPTMKLKRKAINETFRDVIDGMYRDR